MLFKHFENDTLGQDTALFFPALLETSPEPSPPDSRVKKPQTSFIVFCSSSECFPRDTHRLPLSKLGTGPPSWAGAQRGVPWGPPQRICTPRSRHSLKECSQHLKPFQRKLLKFHPQPSVSEHSVPIPQLNTKPGDATGSIKFCSAEPNRGDLGASLARLSQCLPSANTKKSFTSQQGHPGLQWAVPCLEKARGFSEKDLGCFPSGFYFAFLLFLNLVNVD